MINRLATIATIIFSLSVSVAQAEDADLAKKLSNPLASMYSLPFQLNRDTGFGSANGERTTLNFQPVIPISITPNVNVIIRTIIPYKWQSDVGTPGKKSGWGDTTMSFWIGPSQPSNGVTWGVGPVINIPTSSDPALGAGEWGGGLTGIVLAQPGPWTIGALANHIKTSNGGAVNSTFIQPFVAYNTPSKWTYTLNTESSYDWNTDEWTVPLNIMVSKLVRFGSQPVSLQAGARYYAESPADGPDGWGLRFAMTFVIPKK